MIRNNLLKHVMVAIFCFVTTGLIGGCEIGLEKRDCVVMLGDSIFALSGRITDYLEDLSDQEYRTYYMSGAQLEGGYNDIETQYDNARDDGYIRTIIMNGGGNDFFFGDQDDLEGIAAEITAAWTRILDKAQRDHVENIVVLGYYLTRTTPDSDEMNNEDAADNLEAAAAARGIKLVYVDPNEDDWFSSREPDDYTTDNIHPTRAAAKELARLIWDAMVLGGIEQGAGCP